MTTEYEGAHGERSAVRVQNGSQISRSDAAEVSSGRLSHGDLRLIQVKVSAQKKLWPWPLGCEQCAFSTARLVSFGEIVAVTTF